MARKPICVRSADSADGGGFTIEVNNPKGCPKILHRKIPGYGTVSSGLKPSNFVVASLLAIILLIGYVFILFFVIDLQNVLIEIVGCVIAVFSLGHVFILFLASRCRQIREWHACEHKAINLLRSSASINMENLKKSSRINSHCGVVGTVSGSAAGRVPVCLRAFLFINYPVICWVYRPVESLFINEPINQLVIFWCISIPFWLMYVALSFSVISFLVQYFMTTAKPSEDKLEQSLELAKNIERIVDDKEV